MEISGLLPDDWPLAACTLAPGLGAGVGMESPWMTASGEESMATRAIAGVALTV